MKRKLLLIALTALAAVSCGKNEGPAVVPPENEPELKVEQETLNADAGGGNLSFSYTLTDPAADGRLEAASEAEWIAGIDCTAEGTVSLTVRENGTTGERRATVTLTYRYGDDKQCSAGIEVIQAAPQYDYNFEAPLFAGGFTADVFGKNKEDNYNTWLSDKPFSIYPEPGGTYYRFDIFAPEPADREHITLPPGTYRLGERGGTAEFTFSPEYSEAFTMSEDGMSRVMQAYFAEGVMEVSVDGDTYVMDAVLTDENGKTHHVVYRGEAVYRDPSQEPDYEPIENDIEFSTRTFFATYLSGDETTWMNLALQFSDMEASPDGQLLPPGTLLTVYAYVPFSKKGEIASGTYSFETLAPELFSLVPGTVKPGIGAIVAEGTHAKHVDESSLMTLGLIDSGSLTIRSENGIYRMECEFLTEEDVTIKTVYEGPVDEIMGLPGPISTLDGDYTLNLDNAQGNAAYMGNMYGTGGNWSIALMPEKGSTDGDGILIDIVGEALDFEAGIPAGTYTAASSDFPNPGEYRKGALVGSSIIGTMYLGDFTEEGNVRSIAPAMEGDLTIVREENGDYTFTFEFTDDWGYVWDGSWTGAVELQDATARSSAGKPRLHKAVR